MIHRLQIQVKTDIEVTGINCMPTCLYKNFNLDNFCRLFLEFLKPSFYGYNNAVYQRCKQCVESEIINKTLIQRN